MHSLIREHVESRCLLLTKLVFTQAGMALGDFLKKDLIIPNADSPVSQIPRTAIHSTVAGGRGPCVIHQCSEWRFCPQQSYSKEWMSWASRGSENTIHCSTEALLTPPNCVFQYKFIFSFRSFSFFPVIYTYFYLELHQSSLFWYAFSCYENSNSFSFVFLKI